MDSTQFIFKSPLHETTRSGTDVWMDSCSTAEVSYGIEHGATGANTNPATLAEVLKKEMHLWSDRIERLVREQKSATEDDIAWRTIEELAVKAAGLLRAVFERTNRRKGRLSLQTSPKFYRNAERTIEQALYLHKLAPNIQVSLPATQAGLAAIEEATYQGLSINATLCFSLAQAIAAAEAVERGMTRRAADRKDLAEMTPVCSLMLGRLDDWLRAVMDRDGVVTDPGFTNWAGVAVMKKAYALFKQRGYRTRLLATAYRCHMHWSQFIGGDVILSIPFKFQKLFNGSTIPVEPSMDLPVGREILAELSRVFEDFRKAYAEDGLKVEEFESFGPARRALRQYISGYDELVRMIRDRMLTLD